MRLPDQHLSADELESLGKEEGLSGELGDQLRPAREHAESCPACRRRLDVYPTSGAKLEKLWAPYGAKKGPDCPSVETWLQVAGGILPVAEQERYTTHAAQCDYCGPLLREIAQDFAEPISEEEKSLLAGLKSDQTKLQHSLTGQSVPSKAVLHSPRWFGVPAWQVSVAALLLVTGIVFSLFKFGPFKKEDSLASVDQLLGRAYTERRTIEVRIPGAKYAPLRVERGRAGSNLDKPPALLKAEALISENLQNSPNDPAWLDARARADLLDGNYDSAIKTIQHALEVQPDSVQLLIDLGSAYFLRAESVDLAIDYGNAIESLGKALAKAPDDPVALFNRALASERLFLYTQAVDDWEHYLWVEPVGAWANDARQRLAALREKLKKHADSLAEPLLTAKQLAIADPRDPSITAAVEGRIEEYLHIAVREWLPAAYPVFTQETFKRADFKAALFFLADITQKYHRDPWLRDLLSFSASPDFARAVRVLGQSLVASDAGAYSSAQHQAILSERLFRGARNAAGLMRARLEGIYALHLAHEGSRCIRAIEMSRHEIDRSSYQWLRVQFHIEQAICYGLMGNIGEAQQILETTVTDSGKAKYNLLYLRTLGNQSELEGYAGRPVSGWSIAFRGMGIFWSAPTEVIQGYNLYVRLYLAAELRHQPHLQVSIWREALRMIDTNEDLLLRAMAHSTMVEAALEAGITGLADREFEEAKSLFAAAPQTEPTNNDRMEAEIRLATVETRHQHSDNALTILENLRPAIAKLSNNYLAIKFYSSLGEAQIQQDIKMQAEAALRSAITLAELNLASLRSEHDRTTWSQQTASAYRNMVRLRIQEGDMEGALEIWEWYRAAPVRIKERHGTTSAVGPSPEALSLGPPLPDLHQVASQLPLIVDETIISYALFRDGLALWVYDNRGIFGKWVAKRDTDLDQLVSTLLLDCADGTSDQNEIRASARALYDLIIGPIEDRLSERRALVVESDGVLNDLPLDVLADRNDRALVERMPVLQSLGLYYRTRLFSQLTVSLHTPALVVGVANSADHTVSDLSPLIDVEGEAQSVAQNFESVQLLRGKQATLETVLNDLLVASVFHFAGHGISTTGKPGLVLHDKLLTSSSIESAQAPKMVLAVLAACDTNKNTAAGSSDTDNLAKAFLRAGVPHVVASRWRVDSAATVLFMKSFYGALLSGKSVSRSLQYAKLSLRSHFEFYHPYYWAAFTAFGGKS